MPGARELLEKVRTADTRVILISNRGHNDLENEVNRLNMMHYFDVVIGAPLVTRPKPAVKTSAMPETTQQQLMQALRTGEPNTLRRALQDTSEFAHPDTTQVGFINKKPGSERLVESLDQFSIRSDVPITSYGDQFSDVTQVAELGRLGRSVQGVIINAESNDVGRRIEVDGVPTRVVASMTDLERS